VLKFLSNSMSIMVKIYGVRPTT